MPAELLSIVSSNFITSVAASIEAGEDPVAMIYISMAFFAAARTWITMRTVISQKDLRISYYERYHTFSELTVNLPVIFGVMGTLIGVTFAIADQMAMAQGTMTGQDFGNALSGSFGTAITTTIAGGIVHAYCFLLSSLDHYMAEKSIPKELQKMEEGLCSEED